MYPAEEMARKYIEGVGGLFDLYRYEMASALYKPPEVEGAAWLITCLIRPKNRADLDRLIEQSDLRIPASQEEGRRRKVKVIFNFVINFAYICRNYKISPN